MKTFLHLLFKIKYLIVLLAQMLLMKTVFAQPATVSNPLGVSRSTCASGSYGIQSFNYNGTTNSLTNNGLMCTPSLGAPGFSGSLAGDAFNPKDQMVYYVRTIYTGSVPATYIWRWNPRVCPVGTLPVYQSLPNTDIAGLVFDANGLGYWMEFTGAGPYTVHLRTVDFSTPTPTLGGLKTIALPGGVTINNLNGDLVLTPSGIMLFSFDDKLLTVNYKDYSTPNPLVATYIGPVKRPTGASLVGLAYADGKIIGSYSGGGCPYKEINILTGDTSAISYTGGRGTVDFTNITSGIGVAKKLVAATPTGVSGQYDIAYDITVKNFGNVPDSNVQLIDDLGAVFGAANVSNVNVSWVGTPPANFVINPSYAGKTPILNIFNPSVNNILPNYPVANNNFTVRISLRVSNVSIGVIYNNNAVATANGYQKVALRDVSTDGSSPDLNTNDKADDAGEDRPTPFVISVAAETPPCIALNTILYSQDFGSGTGLSSALPGTVKSDYTASVTQPIPTDAYTLSNNANAGNTSRWASFTDRTGNANGRMMLVNADVQSNKIFIDTMDIQCGNLKYSFFGYAAFLGNASYGTFCNAFGGMKYPKLIFTIRNATNGTIITNISTPDITSNSWTQYGMKFVMPTGVTRVILEIYNGAEGGCGNDVALDDIQFGLCDPQPLVTASGTTAGCIGNSTTFSANLNDTSIIAGQEAYQWQSSIDGSSWSDITGATNGAYTIGSVTAADARYYRVLVASAGNIGNATCRYTSNSFLLATKNPSVNPSGAIKSKPQICPMEAVVLSITGGSLGTNASWRWYTGSCGGSLAGIGTSITVNPMVTTTYYARAEGDCNFTTCVSVEVVVNCTTGVLADNFTGLTAKLNGNRSELRWTSDTYKLRYFEVERSVDMRNFSKVGTVGAAGFSASEKDFEFSENLDEELSRVYYRVKLITTDGLFTYSNLAVVQPQSGMKFNVAPNPVTNYLTVSLWSAKESNIELRIIDAVGKVVLRQNHRLHSGANTWRVDGINQVAGGVYTLQIIRENFVSNQKLVIER
jgi:hypothetical protein